MGEKYERLYFYNVGIENVLHYSSWIIFIQNFQAVKIEFHTKERGYKKEDYKIEQHKTAVLQHKVLSVIKNSN